MRRLSIRIALAAGMLAWPLAAAALPPGNVTNLSASYANGQISMSWDAPEENIETYRVYYSQNSILLNDGAYDDFMMTSGRNTSFIMTEIPAYSDIFLSVLAVNEQGEESPSFMEEVQLNLTVENSDGQTSSQEVPSPSRREREAVTVGLIHTEATSPTTVQLSFSAPIHIPVSQAIDAFRVMDIHSNALPLYRISITQDVVVLLTAPQIAGRSYALRAGPVVTGKSSDGGSLPMDIGRSVGTFVGFGAETERPGTPTRTPPIASVTPRPSNPSSGGLSASGLPLLGIVTVSAAVAGWRKFKRKATDTIL